MEAFQVHCSLDEAHLALGDHYSYLVHFLVDEGDTQAFPSYGMGVVVVHGDSLQDVSALEKVEDLPKSLFYQVNGVLTLDL